MGVEGRGVGKRRNREGKGVEEKECRRGKGEGGKKGGKKGGQRGEKEGQGKTSKILNSIPGVWNVTKNLI